MLEEVMPEENYDHNYFLVDKLTGEYIDPEEEWMRENDLRRIL